ncbi:hypothetical protein BT93_L5087 [Corymbia citriodora subsp. variegata]|uniref:Bifunctional inhibitor/plant lipid transfer protein/seed storage helical domain-containing protein n=1 Tax=Corymbia citriodora subsp. variegata TaxID=360336 RepID=A0A8T0CSV1_CORYI|nr:hypothetical protein BT93_L5087 [Corymbia citriodora subsp. variegata]
MVHKSHVAKFVPLSIVMMAWVTLNGFIREASADGECGKKSIRSAFQSLNPCMVAARDPQIKVSPLCCKRVNTLIHISPRCLYAVFHSPAARFARIVPATAMSIPKRCNIRNRPVGRNAEVSITTFYVIVY